MLFFKTQSQLVSNYYDTSAIILTGSQRILVQFDGNTSNTNYITINTRVKSTSRGISSQNFKKKHPVASGKLGVNGFVVSVVGSPPLLKDGDAVLKHLVRLQQAQGLEATVRRQPLPVSGAPLSHSLHPSPRQRVSQRAVNHHHAPLRPHARPPRLEEPLHPVRGSQVDPEQVKLSPGGECGGKVRIKRVSLMQAQPIRQTQVGGGGGDDVRGGVLVRHVVYAM